MSVRIQTLGATSVEGAAPAEPGILAQPKRLGLLGYLLVAGRDRWVPRQELLVLFWPESDEARARKALSQSLWALRNDLGPDLLRKRGSSDVAVDPGALEADVWDFLDALAQGRDEEALAAYGGEFLPGLVVSGAPAFERWLEEQRSALRRKARDAASRMEAGAAEAGDRGGAVRWARVAYVAAGPNDEGALRRLMQRLAEAGDRRGALDLYDALARELAAEGEVPHVETRSLAEHLRPLRLREGDAPPSRPVATGGGGRPRLHPAPPPIERGGPSRSGRLRRLLPLALLGLSLAVPLALGLQALSVRGGAERDQGSRIAVLPFQVEGGEGLAYLGNAMVDLLSARLDGAGELTSVDPAAILAAPDPALAPRALQADLVVTGSVVGLGEALELRAALADASGRVLRQTHAVAGQEAELSRTLDEVALGLLTGILEARPSGLDYGAAQETRSLTALKEYLRGEAAFRSFRLQEAADAFRSAVAVDTAFALAYFRLNRLGDWLEDGDLVAQLERALAHRDRLPRRQLLLLDAHVHFWRVSVQEGIGLLEEAVTTYPTDADAWYQFGDALFHGGPRTGRSILEAEPAFRRALELNPRDHRAALHLMGLAAYRRDPAEAARLAAALPRLDPARRFQAATLSLPAEVDGATLMARLDSLPVPLTNAVLSVADFLERPDLLAAAGARQERESGSEADRFQGLLLQALAAEAGGRGRRLEEILGRAEGVSPDQARALRSYLASLPWHPAAAPGPVAAADPRLTVPEMASEAILAARAGLRPRFDSLLSRVREPRNPPALQAAPAVLAAELALAEGRPEEGLRILDEARRQHHALTSFPTHPTFPHAVERFLRARLLEAAGRLEEALAWYGTMAAPVSYSLPFAAPAHLARARLLAGLGRPEEAEAARARARHLLKDADAGAEDARATSPLPPGASPPRRR